MGWALYTYPPRATPLLLSNGIMFTETVDSRIVGYPEVILAQVVFGVGGEITFGLPVYHALVQPL